MRDKIKNELYFHNYLKQSYNRLSIRYDKLLNGQIKPEREKIVKKDMALSYKNILIAKYSLGVDMFTEEIQVEYKKMITLLSENWEENYGKLVVFSKGVTVYLDQYTFSNYVDMIEIISLGILIGAPIEDFILLSNIIDQDKIKDFLMEYLLRYKIKDRFEITTENDEEYFRINERFSRLKGVINHEDKNIAKIELKLFLENDWEKAFSDSPLFKAHLSPYDIYVGYWCFMSAAIVKVKGLDDNEFRNNRYYHNDLI